MSERREERGRHYEAAFDLIEGATGDVPVEVEAENLEPVVAMLEQVPDEVWRTPEPPGLDIGLVTGSTSGAGAAGKGHVQTGRPSLSEMLFGNWPRLVAGTAAAVALLALGVVFGALLAGERSGEGFTPSERLELAGVKPGAPASASGQVLISDAGREPVELDVSGLEPTAEDEYYEFWLLGAEGELVSLGSFRVDDAGTSQVRVPLPVDPADYSYFDVSIEKEDGSPGHSGKSVLRGLTKA